MASLRWTGDFYPEPEVPRSFVARKGFDLVEQLRKHGDQKFLVNIPWGIDSIVLGLIENPFFKGGLIISESSYLSDAKKSSGNLWIKKDGPFRLSQSQMYELDTSVHFYIGDVDVEEQIRARISAGENIDYEEALSLLNVPNKLKK